MSDDGVEICKINVKNPYAVALILILLAGFIVYQTADWVWDAYRPVDGKVVEKWYGIDDEHYFRIEEEGERYRKSVFQLVYIRTQIGDHANKKAGFFEKVETTGTLKFEEMQKKVDALKKKLDIK